MREFVDISMLNLTDADRLARMLGEDLTPEQIRNDLSSATVRYLLAELKYRLRANQDAFFLGNFGMPPGLSDASRKESYVAGLVSFGREVLGLVQELKVKSDSAEPPARKRVRRDPFDVAPTIEISNKEPASVGPPKDPFEVGATR